MNMAVANRTRAEIEALRTVVINGAKALEVYANIRNAELATATDTALAALKTQLDLTVADATPVSPAENLPI
jgi:hypothetical protein